jgi:hypothetical protein
MHRYLNQTAGTRTSMEAACRTAAIGGVVAPVDEAFFFFKKRFLAGSPIQQTISRF